jgi:glycosyltransferase involved in cell wall biosynthesis
MPSDNGDKSGNSYVPLVSIIIPTMNSASVLQECLEAIRKQTWHNVETIVVDGHSKDNTRDIAKKYGAITVQYGPEQGAPFQRLFGAPYQWNYGTGLAKGDYLYLLASDIRLSPSVIEECVRLSEEGPYDALIIPEVSYGEGYWAACKRLQRSFFVGDSSMESPMFIRTNVWRRLNGFDPTVEGYIDWDLTSRLVGNHHKIGRIKGWAHHYEGRLQLSKLLRKKYVYGKATSRYFSKQKGRLNPENIMRFSLLRPSYVRNFRKIVENPRLGAGFVIMTTSEYFAAAFGAIRGLAEQSARRLESNS